MSPRPLRRALPGVALVCLGLLTSGLPSRALAESGKLNLHVDLGLGAPVAGPARPGGPGSGSSAGGAAFLAVDWQLHAPLALEAELGFGGFGGAIPGSGLRGTHFAAFAMGVRYRPLDDHAGYLGQDGGNPWGNLWISGHVGAFGFDGPQFGLDLAVGYELSVHSPVQVGAFVRTAVLFAGNDSSTDMVLLGGISASFELLGTRGSKDSDGDGLSDAREAELGTNPHERDTDGDRIPDGLEAETGTDPTDRDTDHDTLDDDDEDRNRNGRVDPGETDPRNRDTDGGGIPDGEEVRTRGMNPLDPHDDDHDGDGVVDPIDACPDTAAGAEVGPNGCPTGRTAATATAADRIALEGVQFGAGSATLLPASEQALQVALRYLQAEPSLRVEIGGHTDSQGQARTNLRLSRERALAVMDWLVAHGIDRHRLVVRGYGSTQPIAPNDTAAGRARNRRIEFRRLSE